MARVIFIRGLPASGKTTLAKELMRHSERRPLYLVSKDDIRRSLCGELPYGSCDLFLVEEIRNQMLRACLAKGCDVVMDETFIEVEDIQRALAHIGEQHRCDLIDLTHVPFDECYKRDIEREYSIGFDALFDAWLRMRENTPKLKDLNDVFDTIAHGSEVWREIRTRVADDEGIPAS